MFLRQYLSPFQALSRQYHPRWPETARLHGRGLNKLPLRGRLSREHRWRYGLRIRATMYLWAIHVIHVNLRTPAPPKNSWLESAQFIAKDQSICTRLSWPRKLGPRTMEIVSSLLSDCIFCLLLSHRYCAQEKKSRTQGKNIIIMNNHK